MRKSENKVVSILARMIEICIMYLFWDDSEFNFRSLVSQMKLIREI